MKKYFNIILITSILLLIFPFLSFPELWENIYVSVLAFISGYSIMLLRHKIVASDDIDDETSLEDYVKELKTRFKKQQEEMPEKLETSKKISDISINEK